MAGSATASHREVKRKLAELYDELLAHDGFGEFRVEFRILKRGQKEIIVHCGKQYRYVVDFQPRPNPEAVPVPESPASAETPAADPEASP